MDWVTFLISAVIGLVSLLCFWHRTRILPIFDHLNNVFLSGHSNRFSWNAKGWHMGCHSYLIWSDWILCEDLLHVGGFFLIRKFFFCSYDTLNISNVCLKVLLEWYILPTWYILIYNEFLFQNRFQANMVTYQNLITKSMYDKQLDSGKGTLLHLCDDVIQQEVCNPHYVIDKFNLSCMCTKIS